MSPDRRIRADAWQPNEIVALRKHYPRVGPSGCLAYLPGRTQWAIMTKARELGLKSPRAQAPWTDTDDRALIAAGSPKKARPAFPERTPVALRKRWVKLIREGRVQPIVKPPKSKRLATTIAPAPVWPADFVHSHRPVGTWEIQPELVSRMAKATPFEALEPA